MAVSTPFGVDTRISASMLNQFFLNRLSNKLRLCANPQFLIDMENVLFYRGCGDRVPLGYLSIRKAIHY